MNKVQIEFLKDKIGCFGVKFVKGQQAKFTQYEYATRSPEEYITVCYGMGEFDLFKIGEDLKILDVDPRQYSDKNDSSACEG